MELLSLIILIENIIVILCYAFALYVSLRLLQKTFNFELSPTFKVYLGYTIIMSITTLASTIYMLIKWRPENVIYDSRMLYLLSSIAGIISANTMVAEIFLCCDRCFVVAFSFYYTDKLKLLFGILSAIGLVIVNMERYFIDGTLLKIPPSYPTSCFNIVCLSPEHNENDFLTIKLVIGGINITAAIILRLLIKFKLQANQAKLSYTIFLTIVITIFFELAPSFAAKWFTSVTGKSLTLIVGRYAITMSALNVAFCMFLYFTVIKKAPALNSNPTSPASPKISPMIIP